MDGAEAQPLLPDLDALLPAGPAASTLGPKSKAQSLEPVASQPLEPEGLAGCPDFGILPTPQGRGNGTDIQFFIGHNSINGVDS